MRLGILVAVLLVSSSVSAAEPKPTSGAAPSGAQKKKAPGKASGAADQEKGKSKLDPAVANDVRRAKIKLSAAVGACTKPELCDPGSRSANKDLVMLLEEADTGFMTACQACASQDACDAERLRMRSGKQSRGLVPCK